MSQRITEISAPGVHGFAVEWPETRAVMIDQYRKRYQRQLEEAQRALAVPDDELTVVTYLGPLARKNLKVVTE